MLGKSSLLPSAFIVMPLLLFTAAVAQASNGYEISLGDGPKSVTYSVQFGPGKLFELLTAFDPESKQFVYLRWLKTEEKPKPAARIWDHKTGEMVELYSFPGAKQPLPVIPSIESIKFFPLTKEKDFRTKFVMFID